MTTTTTQHVFTTEAYLAADKKGKAALRAAIAPAIVALIQSGDLAGAQALCDVQASFKSAKPAAAPVNWLDALSDRAATLRAALAAIEARTVTLPEDAVVGEGPFSAGTADEAEVARLVTFTARKSTRGHVLPWIESVLGDAPMTIAQMRAAWVPTAEYPTDGPSTGAIGAALKRVAEGAEADFEVVVHEGATGASRI
jgi:hypothetical protein